MQASVGPTAGASAAELVCAMATTSGSRKVARSGQLTESRSAQISGTTSEGTWAWPSARLSAWTSWAWPSAWPSELTSA